MEALLAGLAYLLTTHLYLFSWQEYAYFIQGSRLCAGLFEGLAKPGGRRGLAFRAFAFADAEGFADASDVQLIHGPLLVGLDKVRIA